MHNTSLSVTFLFILVSLIIWVCIPTSSPSPMFLSVAVLLQSSPHSPRLTFHCPTNLSRHPDLLGLPISCWDKLYHAGISLLLTLLIYSTAIGPWDESMLTPTATNCSTWAFTYRLAPPPSHYLQWTSISSSLNPLSLVLSLILTSMTHASPS